jgi:hypothetical protein
MKRGLLEVQSTNPLGPLELAACEFVLELMSIVERHLAYSQIAKIHLHRRRRHKIGW